MGDRIDKLFQRWHRLGAPALVRAVDDEVPASGPEQLIAESTSACRASSRLTWVTLSWLIDHVDEIREETLLEGTREFGDLSVLGVLCDAALSRNPHPKLDRIAASCPPHEREEPFFHRVAKSPLATRLTQENALPLFRRWNYLCSELRYL